MTDKKPKTYEEGYEQGLIDYLKEMKTPSYKKGLSKAIDAPIRECYKRGFEQGKLATVNKLDELLLEELQNGSFQDRNSPIIKGYIYQRAIKRLKSQLSQDEAKK